MIHPRRQILARAGRYAIVGTASNGLLYLLYIVLTTLGIAPEPASVALYCLGVIGTYFANRQWSFSGARAHTWAAPRYVATYLGGLVMQVVVLAIGYRILAAPHQLAQLVAMVAAAGTI